MSQMLMPSLEAALGFNINNSQGQTAQLKQNGYYVFRKFFNQVELEPILLSVYRLGQAFANGLGISPEKLAAEKLTDATTDYPANIEELDRFLVSILKHHPEVQSELYNRLQQLPEMLALPSNPRIMQLAKSILGTDKISVWPRVQIRLDLFQDEKNVIGWHHDYLYNKGTQDSYTFWMPLTAISKDMGPLLFAEHSHLRDDIVFEPLNDSERRFAYTIAPDVLNTLKITTIDSYEPGDLVVFHSKFIHSGAANQNPERARLTALYRMQNLEKLEIFDHDNHNS